MNSIIKKRFAEGLMPAVIILSLFHLFLSEYAVYAKWSAGTGNGLLYAGVIFDLLFTVEFIIKSIKAAIRKEFFSYIKYKRGWVDFISSIPVFILYSVPLLYLLLTIGIQSGAHTGFSGELLKIAAAVRMPLVLRSFRVVKLFGSITLYRSKMTRHHTAAAGITAVFTAAVAMMLWPGIIGISSEKNLKIRTADYSRMLVELESAASLNNLDFREIFENTLISDNRIIRIDYASGKKYERLSESEFSKYYTVNDYIKVSGKLCSLTVSARDIRSENAVLEMQCLLVILGLAAVFMLLYSRHFSHTVSDVAGALNAGFRKRDYNLMIKIRDEYKEEELYRLARFYNDAYLPAKLRKRNMEREGSGTTLTMNSVKEFDKSGEQL